MILKKLTFQKSKLFPHISLNLIFFIGNSGFSISFFYS